MIDLNTMKAMQRLMAAESDEHGDIRGLRAQAVAEMIAEIEQMRADLACVDRAQKEAERVRAELSRGTQSNGFRL